ncbi:MAG: BamA/TamA family outer membrane protein [Bacteroidales bacterium]
MFNKTIRQNIFFIVLLLMLSACSTTKMIPEGQELYTGIKKVEVNKPKDMVLDPQLESSLSSPLDYPPNNALLGSSSIRIPFPMGLWVYNTLYEYKDKKKGFKHWLFKKFASNPVLVSNVKPELRIKVVENMLQDYGHFGSTASYEVLEDKKDPKKAKILYKINITEPYVLDSVGIISGNSPADSVISRMSLSPEIQSGANYNVFNLQAEQTKITDKLRDMGYFYFRPDFIEYLADTVQVPHKVQLRLQRKESIGDNLLEPYRINNVDIYMHSQDTGEAKMDNYKDINFFYNKKLRMKRSILHKAILLVKDSLYDQDKQQLTMQNLYRLNTFNSINLQFFPDTLSKERLLNMRIDATFDAPYQVDAELDVVYKSNSQVGPGLSAGITWKNIFRGGESLSLKLKGSYEWQTGSSKQETGNRSLINSYELQINAALAVPRLLVPTFMMPKFFRYPNKTTIEISEDFLNRAKYFNMVSFGTSLTYDFQTSKKWFHSFSPFRVNYNYMLHKSPAFQQTLDENPAIALSFQDQFIPQISYTVTYDGTYGKNPSNKFVWQNTVSEAGNALFGLMNLFGNKQGYHKTIFGNQYSQFVKMTTQMIVYKGLPANTVLAGRIMVGAGIAYNNSKVMPYNEQFYIGGANSIRAFTIRSIGPGSYRPENVNKNSFLDQTGSFKLEMNLEYRFPLINQLHGAVFLDAGNIWLLKNDPLRPGGVLEARTFLKDIALGTGFGLRYDLDFLVIRGDLGIGLHTPYPNPNKKGYYNIKSFKDGLAFHLAIGYPF